MTTPRTSPYMYVTWIPRYLTGEKSCLYAAWFKANHQGYAKMPSDFDSAKWNMEHTDLMNEFDRGTRRARLRDIHRAPELFQSRERPLRCRGRRYT